MTQARAIGVGMLGCGVVGTGVARLLRGRAELWEGRAGRPLVLRRVAVRDPRRPREIAFPDGVLTGDPAAVVNDPDVDVVVELVGGTGPARDSVMAAIAAGKHVVTANKALLAEHGDEVFAAARKAGVAVAFEASVAGGVPIIAALAQSLTANQVTAVQGILNGTCNFILTEMAGRGQSYAAALAAAQTAGYAEADPTLDVDGSDAAHKLAILARLAFGVSVPVGDIPRSGIDGLHAMDVRFAGELGYAVKLLAEAWLDGSEVALHVSPVLVKRGSPMAEVPGPFNAVRVVGDAVGEVMFEGPGAGRMPTASAVMADLIDVAVGRAQITSAALSRSPGTAFTVRPPESVKSRFYLRVLVEDRPGALAKVTGSLASEHISIASVIQHEALDDHEGEVLPLVIMTHTAPTGRFRRAVRHIDHLPVVAGPSVAYAVGE